MRFHYGAVVYHMYITRYKVGSVLQKYSSMVNWGDGSVVKVIATLAEEWGSISSLYMVVHKHL